MLPVNRLFLFPWDESVLRMDELRLQITRLSGEVLGGKADDHDL